MIYLYQWYDNIPAYKRGYPHNITKLSKITILYRCLPQVCHGI
ncbi:MAG TPA: hypothetical protein PLE45_05300 [Spirochaetota bacterium]|nr:hypothetical protein [Spirochaetota bacterium]HPP05218.1 hypothetical protein [Spirochaetota bacterium]